MNARQMTLRAPEAHHAGGRGQGHGGAAGRTHRLVAGLVRLGPAPGHSASGLGQRVGPADGEGRQEGEVQSRVAQARRTPAAGMVRRGAHGVACLGRGEGRCRGEGAGSGSWGRARRWGGWGAGAGRGGVATDRSRGRPAGRGWTGGEGWVVDVLSLIELSWLRQGPRAALNSGCRDRARRRVEGGDGRSRRSGTRGEGGDGRGGGMSDGDGRSRESEKGCDDDEDHRGPAKRSGQCDKEDIILQCTISRLAAGERDAANQILGNVPQART